MNLQTMEMKNSNSFFPVDIKNDYVATRKRKKEIGATVVRRTVAEFIQEGRVATRNSDIVYVEKINNNLFFRKPISVPIKILENNYKGISLAFLNLEAIGANRKELIDDFKAEISFAWNEYAKEPNENLTKGAIRLKKWLLENIEER